MNERSEYSVVVSARARDMLFEHTRFLAQVSMEAAENLFDQFEERITSLEEMPERCAPYDSPYLPYGKYRKLALGDHLLMILQISGESVYIDLILDARAENKSFFKR